MNESSQTLNISLVYDIMVRSVSGERQISDDRDGCDYISSFYGNLLSDVTHSKEKYIKSKGFYFLYFVFWRTRKSFFIYLKIISHSLRLTQVIFLHRNNFSVNLTMKLE